MVSVNGSKRSVKLTFNHKSSGTVYAVGSFNNWSTTANPMKQVRDGSWETTLKLPAGDYQFRYFCDGQWFTDFAAGGIVPNGFGAFNSVLTVPEGQASASRPRAAAKSRF